VFEKTITLEQADHKIDFTENPRQSSIAAINFK